jgi:hypothetical protein
MEAIIARVQNLPKGLIRAAQVSTVGLMGISMELFVSDQVVVASIIIASAYWIIESIGLHTRAWDALCEKLCIDPKKAQEERAEVWSSFEQFVITIVAAPLMVDGWHTVAVEQFTFANFSLGEYTFNCFEPFPYILWIWMLELISGVYLLFVWNRRAYEPYRGRLAGPQGLVHWSPQKAIDWLKIGFLVSLAYPNIVLPLSEWLITWSGQ